MKWIPGSSFEDQRGILRFINDFDMKLVKRAYAVQHFDTQVVRAWQGHKQEWKWFFPLNGIFEVALVRPDNWEHPSNYLRVEKFELNSDIPGILEVPGGFVNGFRAYTPGASMMIFSSFSVDESKEDDFRFPYQYWDHWK